MNINDVNRGIVKHKTRKRIGRGIGSGQGKTAGRGHKGGGSRAGWSMPVTFEGGQMPIVRRIPKRGFNNRFAREIVAVNLGQIDVEFAAGEAVTIEALRAKRMIRGEFDYLKILGDGELTKALTIVAHRFSASARAKIEQAGGKIEVLPPVKPVIRKSKKERDAAQAQS